MKTLIINQLKSNIFRFFNKNYDYNEQMQKSYNEGFPIIFSVFILNILFIVLAIVTDIIDIFYDISYWWSLLVKLPIVIFSIINFKIWQDKKWFISDLVMLIISVFIPYYTVFALFYILLKTCLKYAFLDTNKNKTN